MRYLLDTNACIQAMKGNRSVVGQMAKVAPSDIAISSITRYELYTGVEKCTNPSRERTRVEILITAMVQVAFDSAAATAAAKVRAELEARGEMIGPYDVLIAGHARSLGLILVTGNSSEFSRVDKLSTENWELPRP